MKKRGHHTVIIGLHVLLIFFYFNTYCNQPPASQATDQNTETPQPAPRDSALYAKLPDDSYKQIAYRVMSGGTVMDGRDFFTCWISYADQHGFSHSLNVLRGAHLQSLKYEEPRRITVHVSTPDSTVRDFSYMLLPGDFVLFNSLADTAQIDMIRLAMHEFINLDR